jgi:phosphoribosylformimino-5-aminoimidazole carboxamide ribotide isomerase
MDVIPVLDLKGGLVVQGVGGARERYRAVRSGLVDGAQPLAVAEALLSLTGSPALYIADLDAILGTGGHDAVVGAMHATLGAGLWVDAGVSDAVGARRLAAAGADRVIVGTETLADLDALRGVREALAPARPLVSIDVGPEGVLSRCSDLAGLAAGDALDLLAGEGTLDVILLPLTRVGTGAGPDVETLRAARAAHPGTYLVAGGGVRDRADLEALAAAGADAVLVATALHRRWVGAADVRAVR